jgi:hypothetical protein
LGHCQLDETVRNDPLMSGSHHGSAGARRVVPREESTRSQETVMRRAEQVTSHSEQIPHEAVDRHEALCLPSSFEPSHLSLALSGRLMRELSAIVLVLLRAVHDRGHHAAMGRSVAA